MKKKKRILSKIILFLFVCGMLASGGIFLWLSTFTIPDINTISDRINPESTKIYDRTGEILLYDLHKNTKRTIVPFTDISPYIKNATVAVEDSQFYQHNGIEIDAIIRSIKSNLLSLSYGQGGSTITQQVVKNSILTNEKKITRKLKEWVLALKLEKIMSKEEILALYLNESPYGGNIYGIEQASLAFFGKNSVDINLVEAAYLAAIPQAPTYYSPYGNNKEELEKRKNLVLKRMYESKFITKTEYEDGINTKSEFQPKEEKGILAPHFVMYIKEYLEQKYGPKTTEAGYKVITTLDYELQEKAEKIVRDYALENMEKFNAENAALVAIDVQTGQILTMVGSRDYFDKEIDGNFNVALAHRQPGSAFKPFVYATAFNKGYTPETIIFDLQTEFSTECNPDGSPKIEGNEDVCYSPINYDGFFRGPISLRNALAQSINIPAIKLSYLAGLNDSIQTAKDMGIENLDNAEKYGLTLALGAGEVSLLNITNAYAVFANEGIKNPVTGILKIEDKNGNIIEKFTTHPKNILPEQTALLISDILSDNKARIPAFGENSPLYFTNADVAAKTGTTNDYRDVWTIGYTTKTSVGAWAGNNNNSSMEKKVAGRIISPMWNSFMQEVLKKYPPENFPKPEKLALDDMKPIFRGVWLGGQTYVIDKISQKLATEYTPEDLKEEKVLQDIHSILYWVDKNNPQGPKPKYPEEDSQFERWEYRVAEWAADNNLGSSTAQKIPTEFDDIHKPEYNPNFEITSPKYSNQYNKDEKINILLNTYINKFSILKKDYFINGVFIGSSQTNNIFSFVPNDIQNIKPENILKVIIYDTVFNKTEKSLVFKVI
ncbi:MAG: PBP1A family penicillin-binding protein [Patescibacteria group bacterium]